MTPETTANLLASHPIVVLVVVVALTVLGAGMLWRTVHRYGPAVWPWVTRGWALLAGSRLARGIRDVPLLGGLVTRSLGIWQYLGFYTAAAFLVAVGCLLLFVEIADGIGAGEEMARFDEAFTASLREQVSSGTLSFFATITRLGDVEWLVTVCAFVLGVLLAARHWLLAAIWVGGTASGGALNRLLKGIFERTRPLHDHGPILEQSWSFPSGHAFGAVLVYGLLGYLLVLSTRPVWHLPIAVVTVSVVVFVGFSRVILQVHYPSDVLAGYLTGVAWVALCIAGLEAVRWGRLRVVGRGARSRD